MKSYLHRVGWVLGDVWTTWRGKGVGAGLLELKGRLWRRSSSILYCKLQGGEVVVPPEIRIVVVGAEQRESFLSDILAAGAGSDVRFFDGGATCYLAYKNNLPVGLGWIFREGKMLRKLGVIGYRLLVTGREDGGSSATNNQQRTTDNRATSGCAYLCGFHVIESARGQGLYPLLLNLMSRDAALEGRLSYVDVSPGNAASIRGIEKAGFRMLGELKVTAIAGILLRCSIVPK